jgi:hypothetical protein
VNVKVKTVPVDAMTHNIGGEEAQLHVFLTSAINGDG